MASASFARRVAIASAATIVVSGLGVALVTTVLTERIVGTREDARLDAVAENLVQELAGNEGDTREAVDEALDDLSSAGIRVAVYERTTLVAGDPDVLPIGGDGCADAAEMRVCARLLPRGRVALAGSALARVEARRSALLFAAAIAVLIAGILGALASGALARWIVAPLERLRAAVARLPRQPSKTVELGADEGIAEIDVLRAALSTAFDQLGTALAKSERFAADAAHELRTPLTRVRTELELLKEAKRDDAETVVACEHAIATTERLATLVERLLVLAMPLAPLPSAERVPLGELASDLRAELPAAARARVTVDADDEIASRGEPALLSAMIGNGIENALKFSGDRGAVVVRVRRNDAWAVVEIDDDGPGLDPDERARAFEPFHRSAQARASGLPGHGIGLALVAHVAALHGGRVLFVDRERGARLRIELPLA